VLLLAVAALAACGGSSKPSTPASAVGKGATTLYQGGRWAVVARGRNAFAVHRLGSTWQTDRSARVAIRILGPAPGKTASRRPQVAAELTAHAPLVESALWIDGRELLEKGGGLTPNRGTIYGAPDHALKPGLHTGVAYGRTRTTGTAVAWTFRVV